MSGIVTTALVGFFVWSNMASVSTTPASIGQTPPEPTYPSYEVSMTGYNAVPAQTDGDPLTTASGAFSNPQVVAARSVDLSDELPFGTVISITPVGTSTPMCGLPYVQDMIGLRVIADSMNPKIHNTVDILFGTQQDVQAGPLQRNAANALGMCKNIKIQVVGHIDTAHMPTTQAELEADLGKGELAINN